MNVRGWKSSTVTTACVLLACTLYLPASHACRSLPEEYFMAPDALLAKTGDVSVAKVVNLTTTPTRYDDLHRIQYLSVEYEFEVQERLLGPDEKRFTVQSIGHVLQKRGGEETQSTLSSNLKALFDRIQEKSRAIAPVEYSLDHSDEAFWDEEGGRARTDAACRIVPTFKVGEYYLVFRDRPHTLRNYEHIVTVDGQPNPDDKWLSYVKEHLAARQSTRPVLAPVPD